MKDLTYRARVNVLRETMKWLLTFIGKENFGLIIRTTLDIVTENEVNNIKMSSIPKSIIPTTPKQKKK